MRAVRNCNTIINYPPSYLGATSQPCCISVLKTNQRLFQTENSFFMVASGPLVSICHSYGEKRPTKNRTTLTPMYANPTHIHTYKVTKRHNHNFSRFYLYTIKTSMIKMKEFPDKVFRCIRGDICTVTNPISETSVFVDHQCPVYERR